MVRFLRTGARLHIVSGVLKKASEFITAFWVDLFPTKVYRLLLPICEMPRERWGLLFSLELKNRRIEFDSILKTHFS
ncbi:MAG: hypothetical protein ACJ74Z_03605 [Bryobacteraceae bacterium]